MALASFARPYAEELDEISRLLLVEFGPDGRAARSLHAQAMSTPGFVNSFATFFSTQAQHAEAWTRDTSPSIQEWAGSVGESARARARHYRADEEFEARYGS